jgi:hypothetical protein
MRWHIRTQGSLWGLHHPSHRVMVTVIPVVVGFAVIAAAAVGDSQVAATATSQAGRASPQQSSSAASGRYMQLWDEAVQAAQVWLDEHRDLVENVNGTDGYKADCATDEHNAAGGLDTWDGTELNGRDLKEEAAYDAKLLRPYEDAFARLDAKLSVLWPHGSAKWGKVQHMWTNISAAITSFVHAMDEVRDAGDSYIAHDCNGASKAFTKATQYLLSGAPKLKTGIAEAKQLAQEADSEAQQK